ncbi:MAG: leucyl/phenylalanyl-tRNA--protein transferase [Sandaracinaceae bacterium]|nr:leucyl/phenylalanyl-tRNA--protein transferase [Sandaracinaceae bacterium]
MVFLLSDALAFPPPERASAEGLVAVGGAVAPQRLLLAYSQGIFPWPAQGAPLLWFSPDPRFVLRPEDAIIGRTLRKQIARGRFELRADTRFRDVMRACATVPRPGQAGTWITSELLEGYTRLHALGFAHSIEAFEDGELVGGLYGVSLGRAFFGESMFALRPDASKVAFATALGHFIRWGITLVDCQVHTAHLASFGAVDWPRSRFLNVLREVVAHPTRMGPWRLDATPGEVLAALGVAGDVR